MKPKKRCPAARWAPVAFAFLALALPVYLLRALISGAVEAWDIAGWMLDDNDDGGE